MAPEPGLVPDPTLPDAAPRQSLAARDGQDGHGRLRSFLPGTAEETEAGTLVLVPTAPDAGDEPLSRNRDFWTVLVGQGISSFGDAITNTAAPLLVLALTGSGVAMGIVGVLSQLPDLLVGLPAGAYADRWSRRSMMLWADLGRAGLTALIPLSVWVGGPTLAVILLVTFPLNVLRVLWLAAYTAAVPGLVGRPRIARASAIFEAVFNVGWIVGPALAGFLAAIVGPGATIAIDALTFGVSALAVSLVRRQLRPEPRAEPTHILDDIREGVRFVVGQSTLRAVIGLWTCLQVLTAGVTTALIYYVTIDRGFGADVVGLVLSGFAVGSLGGSLIAARLAFRSVGRVMLVGIVLTGVLLAVIGLDLPVPLTVAGAALSGVLLSNVLVSYITLRTTLSPDSLLGRVGTTARTLSVGLMPIGALATGVLLDLAGGTPTLVLIGVGLILAAALFALLPAVRRASVPRRGVAAAA